MMFKATSKPFSMHRKGNIAVMLLSLFVAYFIPYLRGYVPGAYDLVFNTIWLMVILLMIAVFIYYVWNYSGYPKAAARLFKKSSLDDGAEDDAAVLEEEPAFMAEDVSECNAQAYSEMKPKQAAAIFEGMTDNLDLVAKILGVMEPDDRGAILGVMDSTVAAKITKIMDPDS